MKLSSRPFAGALLAVALALPGLPVLTALPMHRAAAEQRVVKEDFSFNSSFDGTGPLQATAVYPENARNRPMMVVQHGYFGERRNVFFSAERMAARGFFCVCISTRGWGGSAGSHDDGGIEIMDILDGVRAAAARFDGKVDASRVSIVGYSNGGANVLFSAVRFPYLFRAGLSVFGISDYARWIQLQGTFREHVIKAVGGTPEQVPDKYLARNAVRAAGNVDGARLHLAWDEAEGLCPPALDEAFVDAARKAGCRDIFVHVSKQQNRDRWLHGYSNGHLSALEDLFVDDLEKTNPPKPVMPPAGELTVIGFIVTPRFTCVLGNGDDAAAKLKYDLRNGTAQFQLSPLSSNKQARARITLLQDHAGCDIEIVAGGKRTGVIAKGTKLQADTTIESTLEFREKK